MAPPTAANGYYTNGGSVCAADGTLHTFHGVDRPSLEWRSDGENLSAADFAAMAGWGANVVRIALNQDFWLSGAALYQPSYARAVDAAVTWAEAAGLDVILDLHWSDAGDLSVTSTDHAMPGYSKQQTMADLNSIEFWKEVAARYKGDGHVLFELYNEPHDITWDVWLNGGRAGGFVAAGMQQLYDAVRGAGANNVVIAGGRSYAYDLSGVGSRGYYIHGYNVMYATHPYLSSNDVGSGWEGFFGHLQTEDDAPVIATEFGDSRTPSCTGDWDRQLIAFIDAHRASWTAWAWFPGVTTTDPEGCQFPSLIKDWAGTPTVQGIVVRDALAAYTSSTPRMPIGPVGAEQVDASLEGAADEASDVAMYDVPDAPLE
ncbi:MAG: glycoside hydrolase family 5 protein [Myxococcota bacterium]|nr:glycoside hydrolase family 5 protein [Myxococcota bacterium]